MERRFPFTPLHAVRSLVERVVSQFRAAAFWTAVCLPVGYVALLIGGAPATVIAGLVVAHAACLLAGHPHRRAVGDSPHPHREEGI